MDVLTGDPSRREEFVENKKEEAFNAAAAAKNAIAAPKSDATARGTLQIADVPRAPFFGPRTILRDDIDVRDLWPCFDLRSLYRLSWGGSNVKGEAWDKLVSDEFAPRLASYQKLAEQGGLLEPKIVYGYFPAAAVGDDVIVYAPNDPAREIARFTFARQSGGEHLCLADYVREPEDGRASDVIALQVVTVGHRAAERVEHLQAKNEYSEAYFLHGFSVQSAEALAEHTHSRIRTDLGLPHERGKRYSWGYGACPDLSQHALVWKLLDVEKAIGAHLTSAFQIVPEQSTAAIVIHHPQAAYFNAAAVRELVAS